MTMLARLGGAQAITQGILAQFCGLNQVPHGSYHEEQESDYLMDRLRRMGLSPRRDPAGNVLAEVPPAPGRENCPLLILQGHMDMVCTVRPGSGFDPLRDTPRLVIQDGVLRTDGSSTLGADNNLGNATVLWLMEQDLNHGPLRLLFTVCEEVGLQGAAQVDPSWLQGAYGLLNTDGFHLGRAIAGSAGGRRERCVRPLLLSPAPAGEGWRLTLSGGIGGHSGDDIHKNRCNAVRALADFLTRLSPELDVWIGDLSGGSAHNAIPMQAQAVLVLPQGQGGRLQAEVRRWQEELRRQYQTADPNLTAVLEASALPAAVWSGEDRAAALALLTGLHNGVYAMHPAFPGVVGASANIGRVYREGERLCVLAFLRCARREEERALFAQHDRTAAQNGFVLEEVSCYHGWPGSPDSRLIRLLCQSYREATGEEMEVTAVHVGLEPSVLGEKNPDMVMVSTGPDILDAHCVDERAPLAGLPYYAAALAGVLEGL